MPTRQEELDAKLWQRQQSTATLSPAAAGFHNRLRRFGWYTAWHSNPSHAYIHWFLLTFAVGLAVGLILYEITVGGVARAAQTDFVSAAGREINRDSAVAQFIVGTWQLPIPLADLLHFLAVNSLAVLLALVFILLDLVLFFMIRERLKRMRPAVR